MADEQSQHKGKRYVEKGKIRVLVCNTEKAEITECFIKTLLTHLDGFEFKTFAEASEEEKGTLSIIAVVRHTIIRIGHVLNEVKLQFENANVDDLERVFVIYFYVNKSDEGCKHEIKKISGHFNFAKILPMNFIDKSLYRKYFGLLGCLKPDNETALQELKCILSRMKLCVNVYGAGDSDRIKAFLAELDQTISSSIELQAMKPLDMLEELISETSPTLICTTGDFEEYLKEKDLKRVFFFHIVDVVKRSEIRVMHDRPDDMEITTVTQEEQKWLPDGAGKNNLQNTKNTPCEIHEILDYKGKIVIDYDLVKQFETFACTWPGEVKPSSENEFGI